MKSYWGLLLLGASLIGCGGSTTAPAPEATEAPATAEAPAVADAPAAEAPTSAPAPQKIPPGTIKPPKGDVVMPIANERTAAELRGCQSDADCAITCRRDGDCCPELCACTSVYNKAFIAELEQQQAHCDARKCPVARCEAPTHDLAAVCEAGVCAVRQTPR